MDNVQELSLKDLTLKLTTLIALVTAQRAQTMQLFDIRNSSVSRNVHKYGTGDLVKQTRPGSHQAELELVAYPADRKLCVMTCLEEYEAKTSELTGSKTDYLLVT